MVVINYINTIFTDIHSFRPYLSAEAIYPPILSFLAEQIEAVGGRRPAAYGSQWPLQGPHVL